MTETWLKPEVFDTELFPPVYSVFRQDRDFRATGLSRGGGVMLAVNRRWTSQSLDLTFVNSSASVVDVVGCKVYFGSFVVYLILVYIPPYVSTVELEVFIDCILAVQDLFDSNLIILGDFNIPDYVSNNNMNPKCNLICNLANILNVKQTNIVPNVNNRLLDLVFSNIGCDIVRYGDAPFVEEDTHHPSLFITFSAMPPLINNFPINKNSPKEFNFRKADFPRLYNLMLETDWLPVLEGTDVNTCCVTLCQLIGNVFESCIPLKVQRRRRFPPWFSSDLIKNIYKKEKALKNYKQHKTQFYYQKLCTLRRLVHTQGDLAYRDYIRNTELNIASDPSTFWSFINSKKGHTSIPGNLRDDSNDYADPQSIVDAFANYFSGVYINSSPNNDIESPMLNSDIINIHTITSQDIVVASKKLKDRMTSGVDGIPSFIVKDCIGVLSIPLLHIFNLIVDKGIFPDTWKTAKIIPVFKKGDNTIIKNYRPISILCNFSKLFEIILYGKLYPKVRNLLSPYQHGFLDSRSCTTNLASLSHIACETLDSRGQLDVIYTDFQKAFDQIDLYILLRKLENFGMSQSLLLMFKSYLFGRSQYVEYEHFRSSPYVVSSGVPQGSNLGPLLFLIFINDLLDTIKCQRLAYADDLKLFDKIDAPSDCDCLQQSLSLLYEWCLKNKLVLNVSKCYVVSFSRRYDPLIYNYALNGVALGRPDDGVRDLGIVFDPKLTFIPHIANLISVCSKSLGFLIRNCKYFSDISTITLLYNAFIRSRLEYAAVIWNPIYNCHIQAIESLQRRFLKYLAFKEDGVYPPRGCDHSQLLLRFNLSSLMTRRKVQSLKLLYGLTHNTADCPFLLGELRFRVPRPESRLASAFYLSAARSNIIMQCPIYFMCTVFNSLSHHCDIHADTLNNIIGYLLCSE